MLLIKMLLNSVVKYISVIIPTIKFILTIPTSTKNRHFHDSDLVYGYIRTFTYF